MRKIKFRGIATHDFETSMDGVEEGTFVHGYYYFCRARSSPIIITDLQEESGGLGSGIVALDIEVDPKTIGQFTGLKDSRGVDIYEGDIVVHRYPEEDKEMMGDDWETICVVEYSEKLGMWLIDDKSGNTPDCFESHAENEVIGNTYENPELLEKTQKEEE